MSFAMLSFQYISVLQFFVFQGLTCTADNNISINMLVHQTASNLDIFTFNFQLSTEMRRKQDIIP